MIKPNNLRFSAVLFMALLLITINIAVVKSQEAKPELPLGNWSFSGHPYFGQGYDSKPVVVISVTTDINKGLTITEVGLKNISPKPVASVKLSWYLSTEEDPNSILLQEQTSLITISGGIPAGKRRLLRFPIISFAKIHKPLLRGQSLNGNFRVEVEVSEVLYEDGAISSLRKPKELIFVKAAHSLKSALQAGCPRQKCKYVAAGGSHYECEASTNAEYCHNNSSNCCNVLCGEPPPGPGGFLD